jgi:putative ATPase
MRFTVLVNHNKILCWAVEKGWITNWRHHRKQVLKYSCLAFPLSGIYFKFYKKRFRVFTGTPMKTDYLSTKNIVLSETEALLRLSGGDGRKLLNILNLL